MLRKLAILRKDIAERQRLAGVSLADTIRLQRAAGDLFAAATLAETVNSLLDRIEDYTQRLLAIDERIAEIKASAEALD